jgi:hypothetical protein
LAEAINAFLFTKTGDVRHLDASYIAKLERGTTHWPNTHCRHALREVLGVSTDVELGLFPNRRTSATQSQTPKDPTVLSPHEPHTSDGTDTATRRPPTPVEIRIAIGVVDPGISTTLEFRMPERSATDGFIQVIVSPAAAPQTATAVEEGTAASPDDAKVYVLETARRDRAGGRGNPRVRRDRGVTVTTPSPHAGKDLPCDRAT